MEAPYKITVTGQGGETVLPFFTSTAFTREFHRLHGASHAFRKVSCCGKSALFIRVEKVQRQGVPPQAGPAALFLD